MNQLQKCGFPRCGLLWELVAMLLTLQASSAHSIRSAASGRANSLNLETAYGLNDGASNRSPYESHATPAMAPGLRLLGPAPAIVPTIPQHQGTIFLIKYSFYYVAKI